MSPAQFDRGYEQLLKREGTFVLIENEQYLLSPFSSLFFRVKLLYDYGFWALYM